MIEAEIYICVTSVYVFVLLLKRRLAERALEAWRAGNHFLNSTPSKMSETEKKIKYITEKYQINALEKNDFGCVSRHSSTYTRQSLKEFRLCDMV